MAVDLFVETAKSRSGTVDASGASGPVEFILTGTTDRSEVYAYVVANTPTLFEGGYRKSIDLAPQGGGVWIITVVYSSATTADQTVGTTPADGPGDPAPTAPDDTTELGANYTLDLSAQTVRITQSLATIYRRVEADDPADLVLVGTAPDFKQAIGATKDAVAGCDRFVPHLEMTIERERSGLKLGYIRTLKRLVGRVNDATFYGFAKGDVLYLGASARYTQNGRWAFTHRIAINETEEAVPITGDLVLPRVRGWEYVWVSYKTDTNAGSAIQIPASAHVEQIYRYGDFAEIGIGV